MTQTGEPRQRKWFLDDFSGMEMARFVLCDKNPFINPNRIE
jgi:hypothetical protein